MSEQSALSFDDKVDFLSKLEIFEDLNYDELEALAKITSQYAFQEDGVVLHQGDVADHMYMIESGRVEAVSINQEGVSRRETQYLPQDYFEDVWLFKPATHPASIRARRNGRMLIISSKDFLEYLNKYRQVLDKLVLSEEAIAELEKTPLVRRDRRYKALRLVPGELIELETKRSRWVLAGKLLVPVLGLILVPTAVFFLMTTSFPNLSAVWIWGISAFLAFIFLLFVGFQWLDWANDYLIITNKRLVHFEFDLTSLSGRGKDTLIDQVQSVETVRPNLISTLLNLGTARVTTAAQTVLFFDYLNEPERVEQTVRIIRERKRTLDAGDFRATMRQSIESYFQVSDPLQKLEEEPPPVEETEESTLSRIWKAITSFRLYRYRIEEGGVITYRKHIFALFLEIVWPLGFAFLLAISVLILTWLELDRYIGFILVAGIFDLLWIIWLAEDWRNDTFQITERYVIDVDRRPFGFGESRKQAQLDNIQEVKADRPNFLATIFNFGNVEIETAGADSNIVFENISNPEGIRNDVFKRRSKFEEQKRKNEAERQRRQYAVLLDVFMQERELDRVSRRTPDFDQIEEELSRHINPDDYE